VVLDRMVEAPDTRDVDDAPVRLVVEPVPATSSGLVVVLPGVASSPGVLAAAVVLAAVAS